MKKITTLLLCMLTLMSAFAQSDLISEETTTLPSQLERTALLHTLYEESQLLEETGTGIEIEANRLAIKQAWEQINPEIAALYKPMETVQHGLVGFNGTPYVAKEIKERPQTHPTRDWTTDLLVRNDFIDGVDMEVTQNGDIYIAAYENEIDAGGTVDHLYIYKSTDDGASFTLWKDEPALSPFRKIQLVIMEGTGDEYAIVYSMFDSGLLQALRYDLPTATISLQSILLSGVSDFGADRNYPSATSGQRTYITYLKEGACTTEVFSMRSTAGSYGFDFVDEVNVGAAICGNQIEFAYGRNGGCYTVFTGINTGNLYANVNPMSNDPASWEVRETITTGAIEESNNPSIKAARESVGNDEVMIVTSQLDVGSTDGNRQHYYLRENGGAYASLFNGFPLANRSAAQSDLWVRRSNGVNDIQICSVNEVIDNSTSNTLFARTYVGAGFPGGDFVSDNTTDVWEGFPPAIAETADDMPCIAFVGTSVGLPYGLYFDNKAGVVLGAEDATIEGFTVYPNPMGDVLHISGNTPIEDVRIFDLQGRDVWNHTYYQNSVEINTASLTKGIYLLTINSQGKESTHKVVKR